MRGVCAPGDPEDEAGIVPIVEEHVPRKPRRYHPPTRRAVQAAFRTVAKWLQHQIKQARREHGLNASPWEENPGRLDALRVLLLSTEPVTTDMIEWVADAADILHGYIYVGSCTDYRETVPAWDIIKEAYGPRGFPGRNRTQRNDEAFKRRLRRYRRRA